MIDSGEVQKPKHLNVFCQCPKGRHSLKHIKVVDVIIVASSFVA